MPRLIEFQGRRIEVPDHFTDEQVANVLKGGMADPTTGAPVGPSATPQTPVKRDPQYGKAAVQGAARSVADVAGMPFDAANALSYIPRGIGSMVADATGAPQIEMPHFESASDAIAESASRIGEIFGFTPMDPKSMTGGERLSYNVGRYATPAAAGGIGLSRAAASRFPTGVFGPNAPTGMTARFGDPLLVPYADGKIRPIIGDIAAGAGTGVGEATADTLAPDSPSAKVGAGIIGGAGGSLATKVARAPKTAFQAFTQSLPDKAVPYEAGKWTPTSNRVVDATRRFVHDNVTDASAAADKFKQRANEARAAGAPPPTAGIGSDDIGLVGLERGARLKDPRKFAERDQAVVDYAQENVTGLRDETARQADVTEFVQRRPDEIAAARDAEALPLLQQAEASGATVDVSPVASLIEAKLAEAKRPPVKAALTEARKMLNKAGSDELDTSVKGLYETRKAVNDIIEGRSDNPTGRYAKKELIEVRQALDEAIGQVSPEFKQYLTKYREGSRPLDAFEESKFVTQIANDDPRNVAQKLFGGKAYGTERELKRINDIVNANPEAKRAWRAAVAEVLADQVTTSNTALTGGPDGPVSIAKLHDVFKRHEKGLSEVFSPDEMSALRRAHKALEPFGNLRRNVVTGSQTAENKQALAALEAGVLAYTGNAVATGMVMKRIRTAATLMPGLREMTLPAKVNNLVSRMWFDPELALHILEAPRPMPPAEWNAKLNRILSYGAGAREVVDDDSR